MEIEFKFGAPVVGLVTRNSPDYFDRFFHHVTNGRIVVPLRDESDSSRLRNFHTATIENPEGGSGWTSRTGRLSCSDAVASVAFTSGTQAEPKGVIISHANFASTVARLIEIMEVDDSIREYVGVPIAHSFGLGRCLVSAAVGGSCYIPENTFDLNEIRAMLEAREINAISTVPTLWRSVLRHADVIAPVADRVRWIEIGSQPMSIDEKRAMRQLFPSARIVQHYGLTEASRSTFLDISRAKDSELRSVGKPIGNVEIQISGEGLIRIRGENVAEKLIVGGTQVASTDDDGWFTTSDIGQEVDGNLCFLGRADNVINSGGSKIPAELLETEINRILQLDSDMLAVVRVPDADRGDGVLLAIRTLCETADEEFLKAAAEAMQQFGIRAAASIHAMRFFEFPFTDSGKIKRRQLADAYEAAALKSSSSAPEEMTLPAKFAALTWQANWLQRFLVNSRSTEDAKTVAQLYQSLFPTQQVTPSDSFVSLGGDSLNFVEASFVLEEKFGHLPVGWPNMSIADLERINPKRHFLHGLDTTILLRFVGIVAIVTFHFTSMNVGGATYLLVLVAGYNFSRFQLRKVLAVDSPTVVLFSVARLAVPLMLIIALFEVRHREISLLDLALLGNYQDQLTQDYDFWFIELLVQILLLNFVILSLSGIRKIALQQPMEFAAGLLLISVLSAKLVPLFWDTSPLYDRVPHMLFWLFALGWVLQQARSPSEKLVALLLVIALPTIIWGWRDYPFWLANGPSWVVGGALLLLFFEYVTVPAPLNTLAYWIGGASMFIYITHWSVRNVFHELVPMRIDFIDILVALMGGIIVWQVWDRITSQLLGRASSRPRYKGQVR